MTMFIFSVLFFGLVLEHANSLQRSERGKV